MNKDIKLLIENIFQREGARELLKRSKAEELDAQIRKMRYKPETKQELIDIIIMCLEDGLLNLNVIDVSNIYDKYAFFGLFTCGKHITNNISIGEYIQNHEITKIDISEWEINPDADVDFMFYDSTLTEVILPNTLRKIGAYMFYNSNINSIFIGSAVISINKEKAFANCPNLSSIIVDSRNTVYDSREDCNAIIEKTSNKLIAGCKTTIIPDSVITIGRQAFYNCEGLMSINIPDSVTEIETDAFNGCSKMASVSIGNSVTKIAMDVFENCTALTRVYISDLAKWFKISFGFKSANPLSFAHHIYLNGRELTSLIIPNTVTSISSGTFKNCTGLTSVTIPNTITSIDSDAFYGCSNLTSVTIYNIDIKIYKYAFRCCPKLKTIYVDDVDVEKAKQKFSHIFSKNAKYIPFNEKTTPINENIFQREGARELLKRSKAEELDAQIRKMYPYHPTTKEELEDNIIECLENKTNLNVIDVSNIDDFAALFWGSTLGLVLNKISKYIKDNNIKQIDISEWDINPDANVKHMFSCSTLEEIVLPNNLQKIENEMFYKSSLTSVTIPNSVTSIGQRAFDGCSGLTSITIPNSVASIGIYAFNGCRGLTSITIPDSVTEIGYYAFSNCPYLRIYVNNVKSFRCGFMIRYLSNYKIVIKNIKYKPKENN